MLTSLEPFGGVFMLCLHHNLHNKNLPSVGGGKVIHSEEKKDFQDTNSRNCPDGTAALLRS